jgi:hypothetical protein
MVAPEQVWAQDYGLLLYVDGGSIFLSKCRNLPTKTTRRHIPEHHSFERWEPQISQYWTQPQVFDL